MSYLISSNKFMKINKENKALKAVLNDYLKYMTDFDSFSLDTADYGNKYLEVHTQIAEESYNYNEDLEKELFDAIEASNDGSFLVEMLATDYDSNVNYCGNVDFVKSDLDNIDDETEWYTDIVPKIQVAAPKETNISVNEFFGEELLKLFDYEDLIDEVEKNGIKYYIYHAQEDWRTLDRKTVADLANLVKLANEKANKIGAMVTLGDDNKFITEDCSSYLEIASDENGSLVIKVSKLVRD